MDKREAIRLKLQSGALSDDEALELARQFDEVKKCVPRCVCHETEAFDSFR